MRYYLLNSRNVRNFIFLFIFGYRMKAISIIGQEVMLPRGLLGLAIDTLEASGPEIRNTLSLYATRSSLPSVVHCTHGKDRTGRASPWTTLPGKRDS